MHVHAHKSSHYAAVCVGYVRVHVGMCACMLVYVRARVHMCVGVCVHAHLHTHMYAHACTCSSCNHVIEVHDMHGRMYPN